MSATSSGRQQDRLPFANQDAEDALDAFDHDRRFGVLQRREFAVGVLALHLARLGGTDESFRAYRSVSVR